MQPLTLIIKVQLIGNICVYHKNKGGLGIRNLHLLKKTYLLKNIWRLFSDKNSLWYKVMKGKYFPHTEIYNTPPPKPYHSNTWKKIYTSYLNSFKIPASGYYVMEKQ